MPKNTSHKNNRKTKRCQCGQDFPSHIHRLANREKKFENQKIAELQYLHTELMEKRKKEFEFFPFAEKMKSDIELEIAVLCSQRESDAWCQSMMDRFRAHQIDLEHINTEEQTVSKRICNIDDCLYGIQCFLLNKSYNAENSWDQQKYYELIHSAHNILRML